MGSRERSVTEGASLRILMVVEARADARTVATLIDKVLLQHESRPSWLDEGLLPHLRAWVDFAVTRSQDGSVPPHATWAGLKDLVLRSKLPRYLGHGAQGPTHHAYAHRARTAISAAALAPTSPNAVVLVVDADAQPERREGLDEARRAQNTTLLVCIGAADPKREAWVLNGFVPATEAERASLEALTAELTLDPCREAHRLRGRHGEARDIKRVLAKMLCGDADREHSALAQAPLQHLHDRGQRTGLAAFLQDVEALHGLLGTAVGPGAG